MTRVFEAEVFINQPVEKVFEFLTKAENLDKIKPKWLKFKILTSNQLI
jgi:uncharacterized protein YndB with AHSA1/START domain